MKANYLDELNERQREAVVHIKGPLMIVAGAGSGKTKVLTTRIAHLLHNGVDAFNILSLTFTNKAAKEMKERVERILGGTEARNLYIGTFHSVFARLLRAEAHRLGYPNDFTIYDSDDAKSVLKTIINEQNLDDKHYKPNMVYNRISSAKNSLVGPEEYQHDYAIQQEDMRANRPMTGKLYEMYAKRCFKNGAMDFDDLLFKMYQLLKNFPEVLHKYQHKFKYIMIDEYQDTNPAQYEIIKLLGAAHENICVVGDDAQSIYSFRGATIQNILQFEKDYNDTKVVKLEQNYRSTKSILQVANDVIANNKGQIEKNLWTDNPTGERIKLVRTMTDNEEGKFVAETIAEQKLRNHYANRDFAILYRTNAQSRAFEENLRRKAIPYRIYGGMSFYQRKEIKDFVAYLRIVMNPSDEESLKRIINYPIRGIGKTTVEKVMIFANEHNITFWNVLERAQEFGFKGGTLEAIENFVIMIRSFQAMLGKQNAYDIAVQVGKSTNIVKELFNDKTTEGLARYENIQELLNSVKEFTETPTEDGELLEKSLGTYLQQITLLTDADKGNDEDSDVVKLMTIHAAKGLEFPVVFSVGLEENLFPSSLSINSREELEEERRLFYVVITRAKARLFLTYANSRYRFGQLVNNESSRFLEEMPEQYIDRSYAGGGAVGNRSPINSGGGLWGNNGGGGNMFDRMQKKTPGSQSSQPVAGPRPAPKPVSNAAASNHVPSAGFTPDDPATMEAGMDVEHQKFGFGTILNMEGAPNNRIATVVFPKGGGEKKIMLNYARLMIVKK
ncbi:ATP-dependent helicase [Chitinophaga sancti]|uniref:DNA 3'-5' helicase n=1 Tax=Chitinophaga sancti TaxID=1004 RepID=A0A1K1RIV6_9BACT|nr:UvrD-helicase domain-containing protein [Chitinophaga sancti]WQD60696.1 UvrD-helicase domain-containing protein [Chitinophaga sancti]WQG87176.1 UvrD-helicase domain-containing protein [Chitinophaga sancti]SFW72008.1 DNA helicase-2 / ATP-dependent DNA helicase PcrA [Chitinophaga sancti]